MNNILIILRELSDKQADVIIATIGLFSAIVVAVIGLFGSTLTIIMNKRSERKVELRKIKENQYIEFLISIAEAKSMTNSDKSGVYKVLSAKIQTIYLVGSEDVQKALINFLKIFTGKNDSGKTQDALYAELILAMKKDLYGKNEESIEEISFTIFKD